MMAKLQPPKRQYAHLNLMKDIEEVLENPQEYSMKWRMIQRSGKKTFIHSIGLRKSVIHITRVPGRKTKESKRR